MIDAIARIAELSGGDVGVSASTLMPSIDLYADQLRKRDYYHRDLEFWLPGFPRYTSDGPSTPPRSTPGYSFILYVLTFSHLAALKHSSHSRSCGQHAALIS